MSAIRSTLLLALCITSSVAIAQTTQPDARILWQKRHAVRGQSGRLAIFTVAGGGYRFIGDAGARSDPKDEKSFKEWSWILSLDAAGRRVRLDEIPTKPNTEVRDALIADGKLTLVGGLLEWVTSIDDAGAMQPPRHIKRDDCD